MVFKRDETLLHDKWSNFANTQTKSTKFSGMLGEVEKIIFEKILLKNFKERPSKVEKGYSQVLVKQTVV